jgi:hypothetical protein
LGTPGGMVDVFHWGQRKVPIPTPGPELFSAVRVNGNPSIKGILTRTTSITCSACGVSHSRQTGKDGGVPPKCLAINAKATEYPHKCGSCKTAFVSKEAFQAHSRGIHKITTAFLRIQTVAGEEDNTGGKKEPSPPPPAHQAKKQKTSKADAGKKEPPTRKSPRQGNKQTAVQTYREAATSRDSRQLSAKTMTAIVNSPLAAIAEEPAALEQQGPSKNASPGLWPSQREQRWINRNQAKKPLLRLPRATLLSR